MCQVRHLRFGATPYKRWEEYTIGGLRRKAEVEGGAYSDMRTTRAIRQCQQEIHQNLHWTQGWIDRADGFLFENH